MSELTEMEQYLQKLFTQAGNDLKKKFLKYTQDFQGLDAAKQQAVEDGNITEDEYKEWRKNKLLYGMHWQRLIDRNTSELLKYNQTAIKYINGEVPQIFASGYNHVAEQIPDSPVAGFDFELINADTVNNLVHEDGIILPPKKKVDPEKDKAWNAKLINAQLLQGIMQGESIPEMAKRMQTVANSDLAGATRTARTMHTAAQNAGRQSGYNKAAQQGIIFEKTWLAANNERTRLSHSLMNGQTVDHDVKFVSPVTGVKLMFPGDWNAEGGDVGSEIYNCRCTLITKFKGFKKLNGEEPEGTGREAPKEESKPTFTPAKTKEEAEKYALENKFAAIVDYGKLKLESMNVINQALKELTDKFPVKSLDFIRYNGRLKNALARSNFRQLEIGSDSKPKQPKQDYAKLKSDYEKAIESIQNSSRSEWEKKDLIKKYTQAIKKIDERVKYPWFTVMDDDLKATIIHEYGHIVADQYFAQINWRANPNAMSAECKACRDLIKNTYKEAKKNSDIYKISEYASQDDAEFFAECFVMYNTPELKDKLPDYISEMIEKVTENGIL